MPKENTHLFFANSLLQEIKEEKIRKIISGNLDYFYIGSVSPDIFLYGKTKKITAISEFIHGQNGNLTNEIIFELLDIAKKNKSEKDLTFIFGFLTHYALDIVFHPAIFYLTGNLFSSNNEKNKEAAYKHMLWETAFDKKINNSFYFKDLIKVNKIKDLRFFNLLAGKFKVSIKELKKTFKRHYLANCLFASKFSFPIFNFLIKNNVFLNPEYIGLFYKNLKPENKISNVIKYRDPITGERFSKTIKELLNTSIELVVEEINYAFKYYQDEISQKELAQFIKGESLDTGKINCPVNKIKYEYE